MPASTINKRQARADFVTTDNKLVFKDDVIYTQYSISSDSLRCWDERRNYLGTLNKYDLFDPRNFTLLKR